MLQSVYSLLSSRRLSLSRVGRLHVSVSTALFAVVFTVLVGAVLVERAAAQTRFRGFTLDSSTSGSDIDTLKSWNVNLVYYFLDGNAAGIATNEADFLTNLDLELATLDLRLAEYAARGIKVAINLYGAPGEFTSRVAPAQQGVFAFPWAQQALVSAWQRIATRYRGNSTVWGYNLLNEPAEGVVPAGLKPWRLLLVDVIDGIRAIDPNVRIIIQSTYGNPDRIGSLPIIKNKGTVVYSFNAYTPYNYTHQGLYGIPLNLKYPSKRYTPATLSKGLQKGLRFGLRNKLPIFIPEFAVVRWAPGAALYLRDMARIMERNKVDWTVHAFYGSKVEPGDALGRFAYPWSPVHSNDLSDRNQTLTQTDRLRTLRTFFSRNRFF